MLKQFRTTMMLAIVAGLLATIPVGMIAGADGQGATGYVYESEATDLLTGSYSVATHDDSDAAAIVAGRGASGLYQWHKQVNVAYNAQSDDASYYGSCGSSCGKRSILGTGTASEGIFSCTDSARWSPTGDCAGITAAQTKWSLYGASEAPMKLSELDAINAKGGDLVTFPLAIMVQTIVFNVNGCANEQLKLSGALISRMYRPVSGDQNGAGITMWNHPELVALNPCLAGEATPIIPVIRCDGSGTTFAFSDFLSRSADPMWGPAELIANIAENEICGAQNPGVADKVGPTPRSAGNYGAFGYVEKQQAETDGLKKAQIQTRDGNFLSVTEEGGAAAATAAAPALPESHGDWSAVSISYQSGANSWPISTFGYFFALANPYGAVGPNGAGGATVNYRDLWSPESYNSLKEFLATMNENARAEATIPIEAYAPVGDAVADINARGIARMNYGPRHSYDLGNDNTDVVALCGYPAVGQTVDAESNGSFTPSSIAGGNFAASSAGALVGATEANGGYFAVTGAIQAVGPIVTIDGIPAGRVACGAMDSIGPLVAGSSAYGQVVDGSFLVHIIE